MAPRRLWGWEPEEVHVTETGEDGTTYTRVIREPEFDAEQQALLTAVMEYDASLGHHGLPIEETTSPDADPNNPEAKYHYEAKVLRDWYDDAVEARKRDFEGNPSDARIFYAVRVDH